MKLKTRLFLALLLVGIIPFAVISIISLVNSTQALSDQAFEKLEAMRDVKKSQVIDFFHERKADMDILIETAFVFKQSADHKLISSQENKKTL
ncbi:Uncharacterized protein dnl_51750 [Desulfonema limicola]|uniref:Uncharacterized protein n=1 Tax=Desulfonema limicola TaxID=45656 RepID=A0A975BCE5_9BACT|nr:hypothetical protein [Desulfonema limicola]QTA82791.1 Uncharacterized protein dnl_51750 [Desulfonema limicola]